MSLYVLSYRTLFVVSTLTCSHILCYLEIKNNFSARALKKSKTETNTTLYLSTDEKGNFSLVYDNTTQSSVLSDFIKGRNESRTGVSASIGGGTKNHTLVEEVATKKRLLQKPVNVTWKVNGQHLDVSWKHSNLIESIKGYYVALCAWQKKICNSPDFVHFGKDTVKAKIAGLAPDSTYILKVHQKIYHMAIGNYSLFEPVICYSLFCISIGYSL